MQTNLHFIFFCRSVSNTGLSGPLPEMISSLSSLRIFDASNNHYTSTIPVLPQSVNVLALHRNRFVGQLHHVQNLTKLCVLTIFHNSFTGSLILPPMEPCQKVLPGNDHNAFQLHVSSPLLYAQSNRLSCAVQGDSSVFQEDSSSSLLVGPGNQLSLPLVSNNSFISNMSSAQFMWVQQLMGKDHWSFTYAILGGAGLLVFVAIMLTWRCCGNHRNAAESWHVFEKAMLVSSRLLMPICVLACALACWFWFAKHLYGSLMF